MTFTDLLWENMIIYTSYGCSCGTCEQIRLIKEAKEYSPELMAQITRPELKQVLIKAICLGIFPVKEEKPNV